MLRDRNKNQKSMQVTKRLVLITIAALFFLHSSGQQMPFNPVSYRVYTPFVLNPAIAGSKDYLSVDALAGFNGKSHSQMISANTRVERRSSNYSASGKAYSFTNVGAGVMAYNDFSNNDSTHNAGLGAAVSYHFPIDKNGLSFVSVGASLKGMYHFLKADPEEEIPYKEYYFPNVDLGVYLYNPNAYAGISVTNLLDPPDDTALVNPYYIPVSRQYNLIAGYKFIISRDLNIVLEPSLIIHTNDTLAFDLKENIEPLLKLYAGNFLLGTYFNDYNRVSFFFQYRYPKFYVGTFFALPKDSPFYKKSLTAEIAFGINFSHNKSGYTQYGHW